MKELSIPDDKNSVATFAMESMFDLSTGVMDQAIGAVHTLVAGETRDFDMMVEADRKAVSSLAYKVARTKTTINKAGKEYSADLRNKVAAINKAKSYAWEKLEILQGEIRKPLDEWESMERMRKEIIQKKIDEIKNAAWTDEGVEATADSLRKTLEWLNGLKITIEYGERMMEATVELERSKGLVSSVLEVAEKKEAEEAAAKAAEEERIRVEREAREKRIAEEAAEAAEKAAKAAAEEEAAKAAAKAAELLAEAVRASEAKAEAERERVALEWALELSKLKADAEKGIAEAKREIMEEEERKAKENWVQTLQATGTEVKTASEQEKYDHAYNEMTVALNGYIDDMDISKELAYQITDGNIPHLRFVVE